MHNSKQRKFSFVNAGKEIANQFKGKEHKKSLSNKIKNLKSFHISHLNKGNQSILLKSNSINNFKEKALITQDKRVNDVDGNCKQKQNKNSNYSEDKEEDKERENKRVLRKKNISKNIKKNKNKNWNIDIKKINAYDETINSQIKNYNSSNCIKAYVHNPQEENENKECKEYNEKEISHQNKKNWKILEMLKLFKTKGEGCSHSKQFGIFSGFSACTFKNYKSINEDKISISINTEIENSLNKQNFFSIFDGHRGDYTSTFLKNNFNSILSKDPLLSIKPSQAIKNTFKTIENQILQSNKDKENFFEKSGSCAIVLLNISNFLYVANIGDSRAIISRNQSKEISQLSIDHKPINPKEKKRIEENGCYVEIINKDNYSIGRVKPYGLSVSRTIGDLDVKYTKFGGKENVISSKPEIYELKEDNDIDWIIMGCDGIYDVLSNKDIAIIVYSTLKEGIINEYSFEFLLESTCNNIIINAIKKGSKDNLSVIFLNLNGYKNLYVNKQLNKVKEILIKLKISIQNEQILCPSAVDRTNDGEFYQEIKLDINEKDIENLRGNSCSTQNESSSICNSNKKKKKNIWSFLCFGKCL